MSYQLFRLMARMDSVFACNDQAPADRNDWRELKRHIVRMKTTLTLVHLTLREERERGVSLTAQTARKLEGYTRWGLCYPTPSVADPEKSSCQNVGSPRQSIQCLCSGLGPRPNQRSLASSGLVGAAPAPSRAKAPASREFRGYCGASAPVVYASWGMLPLPMQDSLPAGWLAFTGRVSNPLDRDERFPSSTSLPPFLGLP